MCIDEQKKIIDGVLNKCSKSENELYCFLSKVINEFITRKYSSDLSTVDDDVSEIIIKIFENLKEFDSNKSSFKTWVIKIANNYMIDKWRCSQSQKIVSYDDVSYSLSLNDAYYDSCMNNTVDSSISYDTKLMNNNSYAYIENSMPSKDFDLLKMKYYYGYSYNEIGDIFNVTSSTVSNRINYIKTVIKNKYDINDII